MIVDLYRTPLQEQQQRETTAASPVQVTVEEPVTVGRDVNFEAQPARMLIHILVEYFLSCLGEFEQLVKSLIYFYNFKIVNTVINKCNSEDSSAHGGARGGGSK